MSADRLLRHVDATAGEGSVPSMYALIKAELPLREPDADAGLVTWLEITVVERDENEGEATIGEARIALVHVSRAFDLGEDLWCVLDAES